MVELKAEGFCLRQWKPGDEKLLVKYANNPSVSRYLSDRFCYPYTHEYAQEWVSFQLQKTSVDNLVIDIDGEIAGGIGIEFKQDIFRKTALIGYWLGEPFWGKGIMTEALKLMVNYCFETFDLVRIQAGVFEGNPASMQVLQKAGFIKEGISKKALFKHGQLYNEHIFARCK
ncbi:RimJ/RimL family protein N-acetyltransferase [Mucilaginibacter gracilis]|uniref:RimJ/RimL family protein N-acetyltransferase n=1 Tax=Mucilaginibacter gracilis TaxID=423350 RepID=A0A495IVV6_9SPHI|nr:GNAT family protein [Mucilaginibacter gracilis]RKR80886.1 RimJ/RimL family protein N-acetyltransferase [Mucilaginibacter gracilis]